MKLHLRLFLFTIVAVAISPTVDAAPVTVEADFTGGLYGAFNVKYEAAPAGLQLQSVKFDLPSSLYTDTTFAPPGALLPLSFFAYGGVGATGFSGVLGAVDGSHSFTLLFSGFDAGEEFSFNLDIDGPCGGFLCTPGAITLGSEFAGTVVTATFGGNAYEAASLVGSFSSTGLLTANAEISGDVTAAPEPSTLGLLGGGFVLLWASAERRGRLHA